jgi:hypothetical protein
MAYRAPDEGVRSVNHRSITDISSQSLLLLALVDPMLFADALHGSDQQAQGGGAIAVGIETGEEIVDRNPTVWFYPAPMRWGYRDPADYGRATISYGRCVRFAKTRPEIPR